MLRVFDSAEPPTVLPVTTCGVLPSTQPTVSALGKRLFSEFYVRAWVYLCRYHTPGVATGGVRLKASALG